MSPFFRILATINLLFASLSTGAQPTKPLPLTLSVCVLPLRTIVNDLVKELMGSYLHMYVRNVDNVGLNFQPRNKLEFLGGEAKIGRQVYPASICHPFFSTTDPVEYEQRWKNIVDSYEQAAKQFEYSIFGTECQKVTREILTRLGYQMPTPIEELLNNQRACLRLDLGISKPFSICLDQS